MFPRADVQVFQGGPLQYNGGGVQPLVQAANGGLYMLGVETASDLIFVRSDDRGLSWRTPTYIDADTLTAQAQWYDRWSGVDDDTIHTAWVEAGTDIIHYRSIDTASADALGTDITVADLASTLAGGCLDICRSRGTNIYIAGMIDAGTEGDFYRSTDGGANWTSPNTPFEASTQDQILLFPGFAADAEDMIAIFWDASNNEISRKIYDNSGDSWAETSIATGMTDVPAATRFQNFAGAVDLTNSYIVLVAWSNNDVAGSDLRCWTVNESAITEKTAVITDSTDDQCLCAVGINLDTGYWYVFYCGKQDGSETVGSALNVYCKVSTDQGSTWGPETKLTTLTTLTNIQWLQTVPRFTGPPIIAYNKPEARERIMCNTSIARPVATLLPVF